MERVEIPGLRPLPSIERDPARWAAFAERLNARTFLRSDGLSNQVGVPHLLEGALAEECAQIVAHVDRLYRGLAARYDHSPAAEAAYLVNPMYRALLDADRPREPLPLARLDCVLGTDGKLRVIEFNTVGVCTIHLHVSTYLSWAMRGSPFAEDAEPLLQLGRALGAALRRHRKAELGSDGPATLALLRMPSSYRTTRLMVKALLGELGWGFAHGDVDDLALTPAGVTLGGKQIDLLWGDFLTYLGYQYARYSQTRFSSNVGDYTKAPDQTARLVHDPAFLAAIRERRVVNLSPATSYLLLSKHLMASLHRDDCPLDPAARDWLRARTARTYALAEREGGVLARAQAEAARGELVLKPCQYGGAHGVVVGREVDAATWRARLDEIWTDPNWVLQEYHEPCRTTDGRWVSIGLYSYAGRFGGMTMRVAPGLVISARRSALLVTASPAVDLT